MSDEEKKSAPEPIPGTPPAKGEQGRGGAEPPKPRAIDESLPIPLLSLRDVVVFPHMVVPLFVGRPKSVKAIEEAMVKNRQIFLVSQKNPATENPGMEDIHPIGTVGEILQMLRMPDGIIKILVEGYQRGRVKSLTRNANFLEANFELVRHDFRPTPEAQAYARNVVEMFEKYIKMDKKIPLEVIMIVNNVEDIGRLADILTGHLNLKLDEKQKILEILNPLARLKEVGDILNGQIEIGSIEKKIRGRVRKQMEKIQKEYYLREQIKAIQHELGEPEDRADEVRELKEQMEKVPLPAPAKTRMEKELKRFGRMPPGSAEATVARNFIEAVLELPWKEPAPMALDLSKAEAILNEDHFGLDKVKERILEFLAVCALKKRLKGPILCLIGPPGVGKTSLGRSIARAMGRKFVRISLGGMRDEAEIRGHRKTYIGAMPGRILQAMKEAGEMNPVILLDEIDKLGADFRGDPSSALLEVLDPEQNNTFTDHYINMPYDLSRVLFMTTANVPHTIPSALRDRLEIIRLPGYTELEKFKIAIQYLIPKQIGENGLENFSISFTDEAVHRAIRDYTREAGVRLLERNFANCLRKVAVDVVKRGEKPGSGKKPITVTPEKVEEFLGPVLYKEKAAELSRRVGVAMGLAWTEVGGSVLPVETRLMEGKGRLILTGQLGGVMQESCQAALSYLRSNREKFLLKKFNFEKNNIHIHFPEAAVPKDGPSAGITIASSLYSAMRGMLLKPNLAMTGEITLSGAVFPVGGIKEKLLAAHRQGIREIILCKDNESDLRDIPKEVLQELEIHFVSALEEVFALCFNDSAPASNPKKAADPGGALPTPIKKGRGRPPKKIAHEATPPPIQDPPIAAVIPARRGRPRKQVTPSPVVTPNPPKRKPGRPAKSQSHSAVGVIPLPKKRGRPPRVGLTSPTPSPTIPPKRRGRPPLPRPGVKEMPPRRRGRPRKNG